LSADEKCTVRKRNFDIFLTVPTFLNFFEFFHLPYLSRCVVRRREEGRRVTEERKKRGSPLIISYKTKFTKLKNTAVSLCAGGTTSDSTDIILAFFSCWILEGRRIPRVLIAALLS
jgi:hypothetical protein